MNFIRNEFFKNKNYVTIKSSLYFNKGRTTEIKYYRYV